MRDEFTTLLRAYHQATGAGRFKAGKVVKTEIRPLHIRVGFFSECGDEFGADDIVEDDGAIFFNGIGNGLRGSIEGEVSNIRHGVSFQLGQ